MIKRFIGLVLILIIFYLGIKAIVFLPFFTNLVVGDNKSPFQVGTDYVNQVNQIYPTNKYSSQYRHDANSDNRYVGRVTLEKNLGKLILSVEAAEPGNNNINIWLTNSLQITNQTEYIDFGRLISNNIIQEYVIDMKGSDISFDEYKYILLVDSNFNIYKTINLQ